MFTKRTVRPTNKNKEYITSDSGGWSKCIKGYPTDKACNVLANCVGGACGRVNEAVNEVLGTTGMKYPAYNCNAENFVERGANYYGHQVTNIPKRGTIMCWAGGKAGVSSDGAGHVAFVEEVIKATGGADDEVITTESGYGQTAWWTQHRKRGTDGRWGLSSKFTFRGFIVIPEIVGNIIDTVDRDIFVNQVQNDCNCLNLRFEPSTKSASKGFTPKGIYNVLEIINLEDYTWYKLEEGAYIAQVEGVTYLPKVVWSEPQPTDRDTTKNQIEVIVDSLRVRCEPNTTSKVMSHLKMGCFYDVDEIVESDLTWYKLGDYAYCAGKSGEESYVTYYPKTDDKDIEVLKQKNKELTAENKALLDEIKKDEQLLIETKKALEKAENSLTEANERLAKINELSKEVKR